MLQLDGLMLAYYTVGVLFGYYLISHMRSVFGDCKLTNEIQNNFTISSYMS